MQKKYRTWIEISKQAIAKNYGLFRRIIGPRVKLLAVVKSNAYGHELMGFAKELSRLGADVLGVDSIVEARRLRQENIRTPILVLGYTLPSMYKLAAFQNVAVTISNFDALKALSRQNKNTNVHIKIDTGMHRQGFLVADVGALIKLLKKSAHIKVGGIYTHFAAAKKPDKTHSTEKQLAEFKKVLAIIKPLCPKAIVHAAATAGALLYPEAHFDMVRVGIGMYGLWPSKEVKSYFSNPGSNVSDQMSNVSLCPALSWKSIISELKTLEKGAKIGYDYTETAKKTTLMAVIPIGYWHGYWRAFSSKADVIIGGKLCKVLGRVSMDMICVDVSAVKNAKVGDEVILLGADGPRSVSADDLAGIAATSNYEIVTRLNPLIKKFYI